MKIEINTIEYSKEDIKLLKNNIEEIINLGIKKYKKKHKTEMTATETILFNIFVEYGYKCLSKQFIADEYNARLYKDNKKKYIGPKAITTKVNRLNRKLKHMKIANKYGYGYILLIV